LIDWEAGKIVSKMTQFVVGWDVKS